MGQLLWFIADADNYIRLIESEVDIIVHHEAHRPQGIGMVVRKNPFSVKVVATGICSLSAERIRASCAGGGPPRVRPG